MELKLSVSIEMVFQDIDLLSGLDVVAARSIPAIEMWGWRDKDIAAIKERTERYGLAVTCICQDPYVDLLSGNHLPVFLESIRDSCQTAQLLNCKRLIVHVQDVPFGAGKPWYSLMKDENDKDLRKTQRRNIVHALKAAVPIAEEVGITLMLEPLNTLVDHAGYFLSSSQEAAEIIREVGNLSVGLLFDIYHQQITEGNVISNIADCIDVIKHLHIADVPGRRQPGTGEVNYANVLSAAIRAGYRGYVGLEYISLGDAAASLDSAVQLIGEVNRQCQ